MIYALFTNPLFFIISFTAVVFAITIHEFAHAATAVAFGDETPRYAGRVSLNPVDHLDPVGTLLFLFSGFGWGKPVPINPLGLENPRLATTLISLAGPASNLGCAAILAMLLRFWPVAPFQPLTLLIVSLIQFSLVLALFNLLPIGPLDGFKIVANLLPPDLEETWLESESFGIIILLLLLIPFGRIQLIDLILSPPLNFLNHLLLG